MTDSETDAVIESYDGLSIAHLGATLKSTYLEILTANADIGDRFASLLIPAVEQVSRESAEALDAAYRSGSPPMRDDADTVATRFIEQFVQRSRLALCREFAQGNDVSAFGKGMLVVLVPTVLTLLGASPAYAALAIPVSVVVGRIGFAAICKDHQIRRETEEFVRERLDLHRRNLLSLERAVLSTTEHRALILFRTSIAYEEEKTQQLEDQLRQLLTNGDA